MIPKGGTPDGVALTFRSWATRPWGVFAVVLVCYAACLSLAWFSFGAGFNPSFFPAAGVTVAAMLLTPRSRWPWIIAAIIAAQTVLDAAFGLPALAIAGFALANAVEPLVGASLAVAWCGQSPDLRRRRDLLIFVASACVLGPLVGAVIGGTVTALTDDEPVWENLLRWWAGDALGVLVVAAPILLWPKQIQLIKGHRVEAAAILLSTGLVSYLGFRTQFQPTMLVLPALAVAAFRLNMLGAAMASAVMAVAVNFATKGDLREIGGNVLGPQASIALEQARIAVWSVMALVIAQESAGRVNAIRQREVERRERLRLKSLSDLAQRLSAALTPDDVGDALLEHVVNESAATAVNLGLVSADGSMLQWAVIEGHVPQVMAEIGGGIPLSRLTASTDAVRTGQPVIVRTPAEYARRYGAMLPWWKLNGVQSLASWPLTTGGEPHGVLMLMWSELQPLDTVQQSYISTVATMVSQALLRARVYADGSAKAAVLQSAVLPREPDGVTGLKVSVAYEPASTGHGLGGDWYDVLELDKDRTYLAVGDVVGHGLRAVQDMAQLRIAGRALAHHGLAPAELLAELNVFARRATHGRFATVAVAVFDPSASLLSYASAGHPPPLLRRSSGEVIQIGDAHGPLLGPLTDATFTGAQLRIDVDDVLVLYTDGLVERRGMDLDTGIARCARAVGQWRPVEVSNASCAALASTLAPHPRRDEVCVMAVRFTGEPTA